MTDYTEYIEYASSLRHELHQCPEIGFDLPGTLAIVRRELTRWGIPFTEQYGESSIVAVIHPEITRFTIGIRADMDALPIEEKSGNAYPSQNPGKMHACGHDVHTANLLAVARYLQGIRDQLRCRVKLLFTPAEEYIRPGCKQMAENGVMDEIDCIIALHVDPEIDVGSIALDVGGRGGNSMGFTVEFYGESSHAAKQQYGKDAIVMAMEAYMAMQVMASHEISPTEPRLLNIGAINGGVTNNVICNYCKMFGSSRTHSDEVSAYMERRIREICEHVAQSHGGRAEVTVTKFLPYVINHETVVASMRETAEKMLDKDRIVSQKRTLGGEDFSFLCRKKPGMMVRLGTRNKNNPDTCCPVHNDHFDVDETCFALSIKLFVQFILDHMDGIDFTGA